MLGRLRIQQLVAPLDRGPQRHLAVGGVDRPLREQRETLARGDRAAQRARTRACARRRARSRAVMRRRARRSCAPLRAARSAPRERRRARPRRRAPAAGPRYSRSARSRSGVRLVASSVRPGQAARSAEIAGAQSTTCSRLSSRISMRRSSMCSASGPCAPRVCATVGSTRSGSVTAASGAHQTPSSNCVAALRGRFEREAGLAGAAGARQRHEPMLAQQLMDRRPARRGGRPVATAAPGRFDALSDRSGGKTRACPAGTASRAPAGP